MTAREQDARSRITGDKSSFLDAPNEQLRHAVIASLIESHGPGNVLDLGCGAGHLLRWLHPRFVTGYIGVDTSAAALARMGDAAFPVETVCASIETFVPPARPIGALVCSEVLYLLDNPGALIGRIASALPSLEIVIASGVDSRRDKPNWSKGALIVGQSMEAAGFTRIESIWIEAGSSGIGWTISLHHPPSRPDRSGET